LNGGSAFREATTSTGQHRENKRRQTSMPRVGFEPTIPVFEREKTFHAVDCAATVIGTERDMCEPKTERTFSSHTSIGHTSLTAQQQRRSSPPPIANVTVVSISIVDFIVYASIVGVIFSSAHSAVK
jgi:hypothetical protein